MMPIGTVPELNQHNKGQKPKKRGARNYNSSPDISTKLAYTMLRLPAVEAVSAVLVAADKAMLWQYMVVVMATPTAKPETAMALGGS